MKTLDERVERALNYLAETDEPAAKAKTLYHGFEAQIKTVQALEFKKLPKSGMTIPEKEAEVYTSQPYIEHHKKIYEAMLDFELFRNRRNTAELLLEYWRSVNSNKKAGLKI